MYLEVIKCNGWAQKCIEGMARMVTRDIVRSATGRCRVVAGDGSVSKGAWKNNWEVKKCNKGKKGGHVNVRGADL